MQVRIELPFFPGFDDEAPLSLYESPDPEVSAIEDKLCEIQEECDAEDLTYSDLTFNQKDYERTAKTTWIEEWEKSAPKDVVESVEAETGYRFNPNAARAKVKLKDGWQEVMSAFMRDNETWLKENCDQEHYLESQDFENWPKYLFEDYDEGAIADMIGLMMLRDYDDIDEISYNLIAGTLNNIDICSYVFLTGEGLAKLVERQLVEFEGNEQDEEIRILRNIKKWYEILTADGFDKEYLSSLIDIDRREEYLDSLRTFVERIIREKYRQEWYKNYIGTKKITFDGPTSYMETGEITDEDISAFISDHYMVDFANYRLKAGHTERQDKFIQLMRDCPIELLDWLDDAIPYGFFKRIAQGGEYELFGYSKDRFLHECGGDDSEMPFEYVSTLEEKYGIDYAVDYLFELDWPYWYVDQDSDEPNSNQLSDPSFIYFINLFTKAIDNNNNEKALRILSYFYYHHTDHCLSIKLMSRLSTLWKKGLISDDWITDDMHGLVGIIDLEWGILDDINWEEDLYPEHPDDDNVRLWLMKLLDSDFANDIADYLKPILKQVLEREKNHNWENGKKAIEAFLAKTSNK